jgi:hypothetical protein
MSHYGFWVFVALLTLVEGLVAWNFYQCVRAHCAAARNKDE